MVEIVLVVIIIGIILPIISALLVDAYRDSFTINNRVETSGEAREALWFMDNDVKYANQFLASVPSPFSDHYGPHNLGSTGSEAWSYKGDSATSRVLITRNYTTRAGSDGENRYPVFEQTPGFNCDSDLYYNQELTYVTIYFVKDSTLYRRLLTDNSTPVCPGNVQLQKQTCPPYLTGTLDASCQAKDEILARNVKSFTVDYYQISDVYDTYPVDPTYTSTQPGVLDSADYVVINITVATDNGAFQNKLSQRIAKVNQL